MAGEILNYVWKKKMKKSSENNGTDLLQKWLSGDITRQQERQLEEKAKSDPFLADAMEGIRAFPEQDYEAKMADLNHQLKKRYQKKESKIIPFYFSRVAAMLAFAIVAGGMFWFLNQNIESHKVDRGIAMEEKVNPVENPKVASPSAPEIQEEIEQEPNSTLADNTPIKNKPSKEAKKRKSSQKPKPELAQKEISEPIISHSSKETKSAKPSPPPTTYSLEQKPNHNSKSKNDIPASKDFDIVQKNNGKEILNEENYSLKNRKIKATDAEGDKAPLEKTRIGIGRIAPTSTPIIEPAKKEFATLEQIPVPPNIIQGVITDNQGEPLIGASILELGTKNGTMTDFDGRFQLELQQQPSALDINYTGFSAQQITVEGIEQDLQIELDDGIILDEVVVTSMNKSSAPVITKAMPIDGFSKFKKYVKKNITLTEAATTHQITGIVKVQFKINTDGSLSDFKILKSLGYGLDEEAIRLLKEGGIWTLPTGQNSAVATYRFKFK